MYSTDNKIDRLGRTLAQADEMFDADMPPPQSLATSFLDPNMEDLDVNKKPFPEVVDHILPKYLKAIQEEDQVFKVKDAEHLLSGSLPQEPFFSHGVRRPGEPELPVEYISLTDINTDNIQTALDAVLPPDSQVRGVLEEQWKRVSLTEKELDVLKQPPDPVSIAVENLGVNIENLQKILSRTLPSENAMATLNTDLTSLEFPTPPANILTPPPKESPLFDNAGDGAQEQAPPLEEIGESVKATLPELPEDQPEDTATLEMQKFFKTGHFEGMRGRFRHDSPSPYVPKIAA